MLFFYLRHGDPIYNPNQLTPLGHRQAEALARRLARYGLDDIYTSSSNRAMETATPTCELLKKEATILDFSSEEHAWEEQSIICPNGQRQWLFFTREAQDIMCSKEIRDLGEKWYEHPYFKDTDFTKGHFRMRRDTLNFFKELGYEWDDDKGQFKNLKISNGKRIALFAHHGFGMNFLSTILNIPLPSVCLRLNFGHTGMNVIYFRDEDEYVIPQMLTLGNDGHLLADNMPTSYNNEIYF